LINTNLKKCTRTAEKYVIFFLSNSKFSYPWASVKDVQATGSEAFSPRKIYHFFLFLWVSFVFLDPEVKIIYRTVPYRKLFYVFENHSLLGLIFKDTDPQLEN
jgi:hypothetical protein